VKLGAIEKIKASQATKEQFKENLAEQFRKLEFFSERFPASKELLRQATSDAILVALSVRQRKFLSEISRSRSALAKANRYLAKLAGGGSNNAKVSLESLLSLALENASLSAFSRQVADGISDSTFPILAACLVDHGVAFRGIADCVLEMVAHFFLWHPQKRKLLRVFSGDRRWEERVGYLMSHKAEFERKHDEALAAISGQHLVNDLLNEHISIIMQRAYLASLVNYRKSLRGKFPELLTALAADVATLPNFRALALALVFLQGEAHDRDDELLFILGPKYGNRVLRGLSKLRPSCQDDVKSASAGSSDEAEEDERFERRIKNLQSETLTSIYR
jgi:hypothetical protein